MLIMRSNFSLKGIIIPTQGTTSSHPNDKYKRWEESKKDLNQNKVNEFQNTLNDITQPSKDSIIAIMTKIEGMFKTTRNNTFSKQKVVRHNNKTSTNSKPWFSNKCRQAQQKCHLAWRMFKINRTHQNHRENLTSSNTYKREINKSITNYKRMMRNKLRQMKQKSPKDFWNYVNCLNRKTSNSDIKIDSLFDFFKNLNSTEHDDGDDSRKKLGVPNFDSDALNIEVTEDEIMNCIKKLKNVKSPGTDEIIDEYIKISCPLLLPIYVKLFNILDTGNIPESWLIGVIKP